MALILAIESDTHQTDALTRIVRERTDAELVLVGSRAAAVAEIDRRLPDLILVSALFSPRDEEELNARLKARPDATHLQTLTIPQLRRPAEKAARRRLFSRKRAEPKTGGCDPSVFAAQIVDYLGQADEMQREIEQRKTYALHTGRVDTPTLVASNQTNGLSHYATRTETGDESSSGADDEGWGWTPTVAPASASASQAGVETVETNDPEPVPRQPDTLPQQEEARVLAQARSQAEADARVAAELEQAHAEAEERRGTELASLRLEAETLRQQADGAAARAAATEGELARVREDAEATLTTEIGKAREEAEQTRARDIRRLQAAAEAQGAAAEREAARAAEAEATEARAAHEFQAELTALRSNTNTWRTQAEQAAREAADAQAELARLETEARAHRQAAEREARRAREAEAAEGRAADELRVEVERVQNEAEARLATELERVRAEAEAGREAEVEAALREAETLRAQAEHEARRAADSESELERMREETERTLTSEIGRAREEADRARQVDRARLQAAASAERETAEQEARRAAETEAAETMAVELARVRAEAERAFASELARVRDEAEQTLAIELDQARIRAEEARLGELARVQEETEALSAQADRHSDGVDEAVAEALEVEVRRVRAEAEARLTAERERAETRLNETRLADMADARERADALLETAAREAKTVAEAEALRALEHQISRVRSEADEKLTAELTKVREEADTARVSELAELRAQMADLKAAVTAPAKPGDGDGEPVTRDGDESDAAPVGIRRWLGAWIRTLIGRRPVSTEAPDGRTDNGPLAETTGPSATLEATSETTTTAVTPRRRRTMAPFVPKPSGPSTANTQPAPTAGEVELVTMADGHGAEQSNHPGGRGDYYQLWQSHRSAGQAATPAVATMPPPEQRRRRTRLALPLAASLVVVLFDVTNIDTGLARTEPEPSAPDVAVASPVAPLGRLRVESTPSNARVFLNGIEIGRTPLVHETVVPGEHRLVLTAGAGTIRRAVTVRADRTTAVVEAMIPGWLAVFSRERLDVFVGGRRLGSTEDGHLMLPPGQYEIELANRPRGLRTTHRIAIEPGEVTAHNVRTTATAIVPIELAGPPVALAVGPTPPGRD